MTKLLSYEIENFRSFYSRQIINLGEADDRRVTAFFGPNSGGKSNTARALGLIQYVIFNSANANWELPYEPFLLRDGSAEEPSAFSITFEHTGRRFNYSFSYVRNQIISEALREKSKSSSQYITIFKRSAHKELNQTASKYGFSAQLLRRTREDTLLITKAREDNNKYAGMVFDLIESLIVIMGDSLDIHGVVIDHLKKDPQLKERALALMQNCDFNIRGIELESVPITEEMLSFLPIPDEAKGALLREEATRIKTVHAVRDSEQTVVGTAYFDLISQESMGTRKFFEVIVPIADALHKGGAVYLDEFGAFLHPALADAIVALFISEDNKTGARLILNTHSTSILGHEGLSREDIAFVEKGLDEESIIVPILDKSVRKEEAFEKRYREGLYGAVPIIRERV
ncbi:MAG: ATP-binding protein [Coriobacteriia bacterium]|nr:ATP-binding protein [Coriobacteriia bacterium]MCL2750463.1 ATP-binding protein [Coriobacteriia bacterium]